MTSRAEDILDSLPHRPPFLFITEVLEICGSSGKAIWRVDGTEAFFTGHFPGHPIVPGVLLGEALAQLSGLIAAHQENEDSATPNAANTPRPGKLAHVTLRFTDSAVPPADIVLESKLTRVLGTLWQFDVRAGVDGQGVARGDLTLSIPKVASTESESTS